VQLLSIPIPLNQFLLQMKSFIVCILVAFLWHVPTLAIPVEESAAIAHHVDLEMAGATNKPALNVEPAGRSNPQHESVNAADIAVHSQSDSKPAVAATPTASASGEPFPASEPTLAATATASASGESFSVSGGTSPTVQQLNKLQIDKSDAIRIKLSKAHSSSADAFPTQNNLNQLGNKVQASETMTAASATTAASGIAFLSKNEEVQQLQAHTKDSSIPPAASASVSASGAPFFSKDVHESLDISKHDAETPAAASAVISGSGLAFPAANALQDQTSDASSGSASLQPAENFNDWRFTPVAFQGTANSANILAACRSPNPPSLHSPSPLAEPHRAPPPPPTPLPAGRQGCRPRAIIKITTTATASPCSQVCV